MYWWSGRSHLILLPLIGNCFNSESHEDWTILVPYEFKMFPGSLEKQRFLDSKLEWTISLKPKFLNTWWDQQIGPWTVITNLESYRLELCYAMATFSDKQVRWNLAARSWLRIWILRLYSTSIMSEHSFVPLLSVTGALLDKFELDVLIVKSRNVSQIKAITQ